MSEEKIKTLLSRSYHHLNTNYRLSVKGHKTNKSELLIEITNNSGEIDFRLFDGEKEEVLSLINPETNLYNYELKPNGQYLLTIKSKAAVGSYSIKIKTYID